MTAISIEVFIQVMPVGEYKEQNLTAILNVKQVFLT